VLDIEGTADLMKWMALPENRIGRPFYLTSANGEVIARCADDATIRRFFQSADLINADGQPMVIASRLRRMASLPERVATTDLFHSVSKKAVEAGQTFFMFGATEDENARAVSRVKMLYPSLKIVGRSHGYLNEKELDALVQEINLAAPDYLWVALGVPQEQAFVEKYLYQLSCVGVIKTSGGLFNFLSGTRERAPRWMQKVGLEWAWRIYQEPRRLLWRYLMTNPRALHLLLTK
jgi:exopolysaccharide biosynthesis WecB/TagA/CpsF family protein